MSDVIEKQHAPSPAILNENTRDHSVGESSVVAKPYAATQAAYLAELNAREDAFLRAGNGIRDAVVFPRLRALGIAEGALHRTAMAMVRRVQWTRDFEGATAKLLGVVRCGVNGTSAAPEVV